jgi:hypothetical protein
MEVLAEEALAADQEDLAAALAVVDSLVVVLAEVGNSELNT